MNFHAYGSMLTHPCPNITRHPVYVVNLFLNVFLLLGRHLQWFPNLRLQVQLGQHRPAACRWQSSLQGDCSSVWSDSYGLHLFLTFAMVARLWISQNNEVGRSSARPFRLWRGVLVDTAGCVQASPAAELLDIRCRLVKWCEEYVEILWNFSLRLIVQHLNDIFFDILYTLAVVDTSPVSSRDLKRTPTHANEELFLLLIYYSNIYSRSLYLSIWMYIIYAVI